MSKYLVLLLMSLFIVFYSYAQPPSFKEKLYSKMEQSAAKVNDNLKRKSLQYLRKLEREELRFAKKLSKKDSAAAVILAANTKEKYQQFRDNLNNNQKVDIGQIKDYLPNMDSTLTALKFLKEVNPAVGVKLSTINNTLNEYELLNSNLINSDLFKEELRRRKQMLASYAEKFKMANNLKKYSKHYYYYSEQIEQYKNILKSPQALQNKVFRIVRNLPAFKNFFSKFSQMGQLFPAVEVNSFALAGLQTRASLQTQIQTLATQIGNGNQAMGLGAIQQNVQQAQNQLNQLSQNILQAGGSSSDFDMPEFTPNTQKTKSFFKRFELKTDLQTTKGSSYFPNMADVAFGLGYKISDNKQIGIQAAYKLGLGTGFNNIRLSNEGLGIRSFADFKFKNNSNLWVTAGYERNYFIKPRLNNFTGSGLWNEVAVAGLSKKYKVGKKGGEMKILYNFLWQRQPGTQQFIYRTGINF